MEMEVAVEKNQRARTRAFAFSPTTSHDVEDDLSYAGSGDGPSSQSDMDPGHPIGYKLPQMLKIGVIGDSTSGKTVICEAFCRNNFTPASKYTMTCGVGIYGKCICSASLGRGPKSGQDEEKVSSERDEKVHLVLMDSAGKDLYREYLPKYWDKLDAVMLVIDLTSPTALETSGSWMELITPSLNSQSQGKKVGVLIGNKTDLREQRVVSYEAAKGFASEHNLEYFECSVRNNSGFEEPFHFLAREWFEFQHQQSRLNRGTSSLFKGQGGTDGGRNSRRP